MTVILPRPFGLAGSPRQIVTAALADLAPHLLAHELAARAAVQARREAP